ncbi:copper-containing nitrite reductase [Halobacterium rubrum]|uniref:copper-containing nitrite reductase n=1 Tax=Halobacterium TaxID=2239 RepID=UPI001F01C47B|nr:MULTISPECIES: copper-containing nitrite reductase [Halobacterium]MDH5019965.1 copper-containing nitrite reductase [Halobacterium rubrum]
MFDTTRRKMLQALGVGGATATIAGCAEAPTDDTVETEAQTMTEQMQNSTPNEVDVDTVAADPTDVPDPIDRDEPKTHDITLETKEVTAEIEPGVTFDYMTFDGQVPGPMIRVREGDTLNLTLENPEGNQMPHNVDFHAVYGTGGAAEATTVNPGESASVSARLEYPGAFIYHCAVPNLDMHISAGMYGMILVEPKDGLPEVDHEFYFGQNEIYTDKSTGKEGHHAFNMDAMADENPTYVTLNGEKYAYAAANKGPLEVQKGDSVRVYMVTGGPNVTSNFHPIGNVWTEAWPNGAIASEPDKNAQTMKVAPGSCFVGTMETPVPERIKLVDHALSRVARKGLLAEVDVLGEEEPEIFDPDPNE